MDVAPDPGAEGPCVVRHPGRTGEADGACQVLDLFGQPEAQVHFACPRVVSGLQVSKQEACGGNRNGHPSQWADEDQPGRCHPPP